MDTPLLDRMIAEYDSDPISFAKAHVMVAAADCLIPAYPSTEMLSECRWNPCTFILFGLAGETHEQYHRRKGVY